MENLEKMAYLSLIQNQNSGKNGRSLLHLGTETLVQKPLSKNEMQNLKKKMAYLSEPRPYSRHPLHKENPKLKANGLPLGTETLVQKPLSKNEMQNKKKNGLPLGIETLV
jgi:hypothetical protein